MKASMRERLELAIANLNRLWDDLSDEDYDAAMTLENTVLIPLYSFAVEQGVDTPPEQL